MANRSGWMGLALGVVVAAGVLGAASRLVANQKSAGAGKLAAVDIVYVFNEYQRMKDLEEERKSVTDRLQKENEERRKKIDAMQVTLEQMQPTDPAYRQRTQEMLRMQIEYKNWYDLMQADLAREIGVWTRKVYLEIIEATTELAKREGIDLVIYHEDFTPTGFDPDTIKQQIRERKVIYASENATITRRVLDELNSKYRAQPRQQMMQLGVQ